MTVFKWSQTAGSDDSADPTINWRENQAPSTLNDSARAMMAAIAKFRDDNGGFLSALGTDNYTLTSNQGLGSGPIPGGFRISFYPANQNTMACTLTVDSTPAHPLRYAAGVDFTAGQLLTTRPYDFSWNSNTSEWLLVGDVGLGNTAALTSIAGTGPGSTTGVLKKTAANTYALDEGDTAIIFEKDNSGAVLATGIMGDLRIPFACTILEATLLADQSGSAVVDIWKVALASYPPVVGNSIVASDPPTLSSASHETDTTLTGWTTSIAAGDCLRFNLNSVTTITRLTLVLKVKRF